MQVDAQRCTDDLSAICRAVMRPGARTTHRGLGLTANDAIRADIIAYSIARNLASAHVDGLDIGAAMARILAQGKVAA